MATLQFDRVSKRFQTTTVLDHISLTVKDGEFVVLVGPSGCGKSTLLRLVAGLESLSEGSIRLDGHCMETRSPKDRDIAMVFQNYALYPHMSVYDNLAFGLKMRRTPKPVIQQKVAEVAQMLELTPLLKRKPKQLSGGQRQRVALGRAIVRSPKAFLMDEPLSNLDARLRLQMRHELLQLHQRLRTTTLYVTHDQTEALTLGQRIVVLNGGKIQQVDTPETVYQYPANRFVANFIGQMNLLPAQRVDHGIHLLGQTQTAVYAVPPSALAAFEQAGVGVGDALTVGFRPEATQLLADSAEPLPEHWTIQATYQRQELLGHERQLHLLTQDDTPLVVRVPMATQAQAGQSLRMQLPFSALRFFHGASEQAIYPVAAP